MKIKIKRITLSLALVFTAGGVALNIIARNHAHAMLHFTNGGQRTDKPEALSFLQKAKVLLAGVNVPRPHGQTTPAEVGLDFQSVRISCQNGVQLGAWYCPAVSHDTGTANGTKMGAPTPYPSQEGIDNKTLATNEFPSLEGTGVGSPFRSNLASLPLVLLFHGYSSDKSSLLGEAVAFHAMGYPILLVDFRGSGESSESHTSVGFQEADDVAAAVLYAKSNLPQRRMVLFGQSMGAVAILRAMHNQSVQPDAVIVEAVFDTLLNTVRHRFQAMGIPSFPSAQLLVFWGGRQIGFDGFRHNPVEYARSVSCPILFLHGSDDPRARIDEGRRVYETTPAPKRFKTFPDTGHASYVSWYPQQWKDAIQEFLTMINLPPADNALTAIKERGPSNQCRARPRLRRGKPCACPAFRGVAAVPHRYRTALDKLRPYKSNFLLDALIALQAGRSFFWSRGAPEPSSNRTGLGAGRLQLRMVKESNFRPDRTTPGAGDCVVLLHGMGRTARAMKKLETQFRANGFRVVNVGYPSTRAPVEILATKHLARAVASLGARPGQRIHFVTHSLGGIVAAYYLQHHPLPNLGRVVMLAPPGRGSELADRWRNNFIYRLITGPAGQQLGTESSSLPNSLEPAPYELGIIAGDRTLNPWTSHIIPGADDGKVAVARARPAGAKDFLVLPATHTFIMRNKAAIRQALHFINHGNFKR